MLSKEKIDGYRLMSTEDRLRLVLEMCRDSSRFLLMGNPDQVDRKFRLIARENDLRNVNMLRAIARTRKSVNG